MDRIPAAKQLCELDKTLINHLIEQLVSHDNTKGAASVIKEFKLSIDDFPDLKEFLPFSFKSNRNLKNKQ